MLTLCIGRYAVTAKALDLVLHTQEQIQNCNFNFMCFNGLKMTTWLVVETCNCVILC
jgi:hypothetical protein